MATRYTYVALSQTGSGPPGPKGDTGSPSTATGPQGPQGLSGAQGPVGPAASAESKTLLTSNITSKSVTLLSAPSPSLVRLSVVSGTAQRYGSDYAVEGNVLSWANLGLDGVLEAGDVLIIEY